MGLDWISSLDDADQQNDNGHYQEKVNVAPERIGTDHSQQPENQQDHKDCPEHSFWASQGLPKLRAGSEGVYPYLAVGKKERLLMSRGYRAVIASACA